MVSSQTISFSQLITSLSQLSQRQRLVLRDELEKYNKPKEPTLTSEEYMFLNSLFHNKNQKIM